MFDNFDLFKELAFIEKFSNEFLKKKLNFI